VTKNNAVNTTLSGQTGTGSFLGSISPTFITPVLGTPSSGIFTNITVGGGLRSFQIFTTGTAATYTKPANVTSILIELVGGGGGGGPTSATAAAQLSCAGGGGAGGYARLYVASAAATYTYTVGTGGGSGVAGGTTTFSASSLQATGGQPGLLTGVKSTSGGGSSPGGLGGVGSNGDVNSKGESAEWGMTALTAQYPGNGGSSHFSGGGPVQQNGAGFPGLSGSGGGGGSTDVSSAAHAGGAGGAGLIIVWEFA
jgi:hypothetical protein